MNEEPIGTIDLSEAFTPEAVAARVEACRIANADPNKDPNIVYSPYIPITQRPPGDPNVKLVKVTKKMMREMLL